MRKSLISTLVFGGATFLVSVACSTATRDGYEGDKSANEPGAFLPPTQEAGTNQTGGPLNECAAETFQGKRVELDLYFIVDSSGSMREAAGSGGTGTKWAAVKDAITNFVTDQGSIGLGMAMKFFPTRDSRAPETCTETSQCTAGGINFGKCFYRVCANEFPPGLFQPMPWCDTDADCGGQAGTCVALGECQALIGLPDYCVADNNCFGLFADCKAYSGGFCENASTCNVGEYEKPAVAMAKLPDNVPQITSALNRTPDGATPMGPALEGALEFAKNHTQSTPGHASAVVLVTDGLPAGECAPTNISTIASYAYAASNGSQHVKTFVIGVFNDGEKEQATTDLNQIASKGGTGQAIVISNTAADVTQELVKALDAVRGKALPCEFEIPKSDKGPIDYKKVNVNFSTSGGGSVTLGYKGQEASCGSDEGWYYDTDPSAHTPSRIILCPKSCEGMKDDTLSANAVSVALGCATVVK